MTGLNPDGLGRNRSFESVETEELNHALAVLPGDDVASKVAEAEAAADISTLIFAAGTHLFSGVTVTDDLDLIGQGAKTTLKLDADDVLLDFVGWKGRLSGVTIEGQGGGETNELISLKNEDTGGFSYNFEISNVLGRNFNGPAFLKAPALADDGVSQNDIFNGLIQNVDLTTSSGDRGIWFQQDGSNGGADQMTLKNVRVAGFQTAGIHIQASDKVTIERPIATQCAVGMLVNDRTNLIDIVGANCENNTVGAEIATTGGEIRDSQFWKSEETGLDLSGSGGVTLTAVKCNQNNQSASGFSDTLLSSATKELDYGAGNSLGAVGYDGPNIKPINFSHCQTASFSWAIDAGTTTTIGMLPTRDFTGGTVPKIYSLGITDHAGANSGLQLRVLEGGSLIASTSNKYDHGFPIATGSDDGAIYTVEVNEFGSGARDVTGIVQWAWD